MRLSELQTGQKAYIKKVHGSGAFRKRILEMGFVRGEEVKSILNAPLKDPIKYEIMDYDVSLRRSEAVLIELTMIREETNNSYSNDDTDTQIASEPDYIRKFRTREHNYSEKSIKVALIGNPNSGKTSIFNLASGAHEHVGNYSGVTVDSKEGIIKHNGYKFTLVDLPVTYSVASYSPE